MTSADPNEPPRQDILLKLLKMTTSSNDGEALTAIRKANAVLNAGGWDWDKLFSRKIVIIEDPFSKIETPRSRTSTTEPPPYARPAPTNWGKPPPSPPPHAARPAPAAPPPRAQPTPRAPYSNKANLYAGWCYCCGDTVPVKSGFVFRPYDHNSKAPDKSVTICPSCNQNRVSVMRSSAPRTKPLSAAPDLNQL
jgi:hypothetical protein